LIYDQSKDNNLLKDIEEDEEEEKKNNARSSFRKSVERDDESFSFRYRIEN
jgi:hypothetical protein